MFKGFLAAGSDFDKSLIQTKFLRSRVKFLEHLRTLIINKLS